MFLKNKITITNDKGRLSKDEIDRMVQEAEKYRSDDEKQRDRVAAKNTLESYCFNVKQTMDDEKVKPELNTYHYNYNGFFRIPSFFFSSRTKLALMTRRKSWTSAKRSSNGLMSTKWQRRKNLSIIKRNWSRFPTQS